jgi:alpha-tubulin suppressor-like RCC1 family protein
VARRDRRSDGQLGLWNFATSAFVKDSVHHANPIQVLLPPNGTQALSVDTVALSTGGPGRTCAIRQSDKALLCWGSNARGVLGRAVSTNPLPGQETPSPVCTASQGCPLLIASAAGIGYQHACAITAGKVRCWGANDNGQLGDRLLVDRSVASMSREVETAASVSGLAVGEYHTCALLVDGRVQCWGHKLGLGNSATEDSPVTVWPTW